MSNQPKWSISKKSFVDCSQDYTKAQEDIKSELIKLGESRIKLQSWVDFNNGDFEITL